VSDRFRAGPDLILSELIITQMLASKARQLLSDLLTLVTPSSPFSIWDTPTPTIEPMAQDEKQSFDSSKNFKIRSMKLWSAGRKQIDLAEVEMPGLMACRQEMGTRQPLKGALIMGSLHMTVQTAVLIETLQALGAKLRWCSCNIFSTQGIFSPI